MRTAVLSGEPRQSRRQRVKASEEDDRSTVQAWREGYALTLAGFTRSIAVMEMAGQAEENIAGTLRTIAAQTSGAVAVRRLRLADDAVRGARTAAEHGERLLQQARRWAEHTDMVALLQAPDHAGTVLARTAEGGAPRELTFHQRLADIHKRLADLQLAGPKPQPGDDPAPRMTPDAQQCAQEAQRHCQDAVAHLLQARQLAAEALYRSAGAHDRAAEANARSADAGIGDVANHNRMAALHRAAARANRQRAQQARSLSAQEPGSESGNGLGKSGLPG